MKSLGKPRREPASTRYLSLRAGRMRVLDHRRAALDDVVERVLPDDLAGGRARSCAGCGRTRRRRGTAWTRSRDDRRAGRSSRCPTTGRLDGLVRLVALLAHAGGEPAADGRLPDEVEVLGRRPQAVQPPRLVAEERGDLDAVAAVLDGRRRVDGHAVRRLRDEDAGGRRRRGRPGSRPTAAAGPTSRSHTSWAQPPATKTPAAMTTRRTATRVPRRRRRRRRPSSRPRSLT